MADEIKKPWYKHWWARAWMIALIVLVAIIIFFSVAGRIEKEATTSQPALTENQPEQPAQENFLPNYYKIGENVQVGDIKWKVTETPGRYETLEIDYIIVDLRAELTGKERVDPDFDDAFILIDSEERRFHRSFQPILWLFKKDSLRGDELNPGLPISGAVAFEIPKTATGFKLEIGRGEVVDLGPPKELPETQK